MLADLSEHGASEGFCEGIRVGNAYGDGQAALGISIHQQHALALTGQSHPQIHCGGCLSNAALLAGDGDDFAVVHLIALLCDENKKTTFQNGKWLS